MPHRPTARGGRRPFGRSGGGGKQRPLWVKVALRTLLGLLALVLIGIIALFIIYWRTQIPQPNADAAKQLSIVYYSDGKTELDRFSSVNREDVELSKVPVTVQREFLAAEDRNFYKNNGVSVTGIVRAFWTNLRGGQQQGGSTITQQYVKNYFLTQDRTITRKLKEVMIAIKIDRLYSKDEILKNYLNSIYFGRNSYGIEAASKTYFGKDVSTLNPSEGAFLASVINAPGLYDPANGTQAKEAVRARMNYVLDGMVQMGWMDQQTKSRQSFPNVLERKAPTYGSGPTGYITAAVRNELKNTLKLSDADIDRGGLRITTTIEKTAQDAAVRAMDDNIPNVATTKTLHAGLISQKPDGAIVAMYGGRDYRKSNFNSATQAAPQGGSSYKAFALIAALENGYSLGSRFSGASPLTLPGVAKPLGNSNGESFGDIDLSYATAHSVNTAFLRLNLQMGPAKTRAAAIAAGIPATSPGLGNDTTNVLGTASTRVIDMARAYSTISSEGKRATAYLISKVSSVAGDYTFQASPKTEQVVAKDVAADVTTALNGVTQPGGTGYSSLQRAGFTRPSAGKTGTTDQFKAAWYTGFTPNQLTTSVGMYAGDGTASLAAEGASFYGGDVPATIWAEFMNAALKGQPVAQLPTPGNVHSTPATTSAPPVTSTSSAPSSTTAPSSTSTSTSSTTSTATSSSSSSTTSAPSSSTTVPSSTSQATSTQPPVPTVQPSATVPPAATAPPAATPAAAAPPLP